MKVGRAVEQQVQKAAWEEGYIELRRLGSGMSVQCSRILVLPRYLWVVIGFRPPSRTMCRPEINRILL
jgi:hypothetical protein